MGGIFKAAVELKTCLVTRDNYNYSRRRGVSQMLVSLVGLDQTWKVGRGKVKGITTSTL